MTDPHAVVSPGGVGFDINCGVRLLRTNLTEADIEPVKEQLAQERQMGTWMGGWVARCRKNGWMDGWVDGLGSG